MSNNGNSGSVLAAFMIGAAAGAAVALLYAPAPGDETRRKLAERAREGREKAETLARELVDIMQILHGPCHMEVGIAQFYLALALEEQGKIVEAMQVRKRARKILFGQGLWRN